jgi:hypothetical protein
VLGAHPSPTSRGRGPRNMPQDNTAGGGLTADAQRTLRIYLDALFGAEPAGGFIEVRYKLTRDPRTKWGKKFFPCEDPGRAAAFIERQGALTDTYVGVAPRRANRGSKDAVKRVHALFVDADEPEAQPALRAFDPAASILISTGRPGLHGYWPLFPPASPDKAEAAIRRLRAALGADPRAMDASRVLRPPATCNFKYGEPRPVTCERMEVAYYTSLEEVVGSLPDVTPPAPKTAPRAVQWQDADDPLRGIEPTVYVAALTGQVVGRDGKIHCPFPDHEDSDPSFHVYPTADEGVWCFGCGRGGSIIDLGEHLYGIEPRGAGYHEIRRRLAADLLGTAA